MSHEMFYCYGVYIQYSCTLVMFYVIMCCHFLNTGRFWLLFCNGIEVAALIHIKSQVCFNATVTQDHLTVFMNIFLGQQTLNFKGCVLGMPEKSFAFVNVLARHMARHKESMTKSI